MRRWIAIPLLLAIMGLLLKPTMCLQTCLGHTSMEKAAAPVATQRAQIKMSCHGTPMPDMPELLPLSKHPDMNSSCGPFNTEVISTAAKRVFALAPMIASLAEPVPTSHVHTSQVFVSALHSPDRLQVLRL